ncbi:uncharacterized protein LOC112085199 [Eutrema salsugineum]|uniref:uncharacterized protein LOC112085199 n=1 Tax=Eutrema salsugineum TaxID=72664 RepID=UPI000CED0350|nr:uncharacterized protein LOC112085199 [Eutrema salsugineum]
MAFFSEKVHRLASTSSHGEVIVWDITEGGSSSGFNGIISKKVLNLCILLPHTENRINLSGKRRICWHCNNKDILVVLVDYYILQIDITKFGGNGAETRLECNLSVPSDVVQIVGRHDGLYTDLTMCELSTNKALMISSIVNGYISIWRDDMSKRVPKEVSSFLADEGGVWTVSFVKFKDRPAHSVILTGDSLNHKIKVFITNNATGWLLPNLENWSCVQTVTLNDPYVDLFCLDAESVRQYTLLRYNIPPRHVILASASDPATEHMKSSRKDVLKSRGEEQLNVTLTPATDAIGDTIRDAIWHGFRDAVEFKIIQSFEKIWQSIFKQLHSMLSKGIAKHMEALRKDLHPKSGKGEQKAVQDHNAILNQNEDPSKDSSDSNEETMNELMRIHKRFKDHIENGPKDDTAELITMEKTVRSLCHDFLDFCLD